MRFLARALVVAGLIAFAGSSARSEGSDPLSQEEMAIADCVGLALALEQALRELTGGAGAIASATARADALLNRAITSHVGVGRVELFRRRAALALAAESIRMQVILEITGNAERLIARSERDFIQSCRDYLE